MHAHFQTPDAVAVRHAGRPNSMISIVAPVASSRARCAVAWLSGTDLKLETGLQTANEMGGGLRRRIEVKPH